MLPFVMHEKPYTAISLRMISSKRYSIISGSRNGSPPVRIKLYIPAMLSKHSSITCLLIVKSCASPRIQCRHFILHFRVISKQKLLNITLLFIQSLLCFLIALWRITHPHKDLFFFWFFLQWSCSSFFIVLLHDVC